MVEVEAYLIKRDGWARICEIRVENRSITTPAVISLDGEKSLLDKIDFDLVPYSLKALDEEKFKELYREDENFIVGTGLSVLSPSELVRYLIELRKKSIAKPLIVTGIATPQNLPLLCYFGVDVVDNSRVVMAAHEGYYLLENGFFPVEKLKGLPCLCKACERVRADFSNLDRKEKTEFLKEHNTLKLQEQARLLREIIRSETLRNFIEARAKTSPELTVMLRKAETDFFEEMYPRFKRSIVYMNTMESFKRPEVKYFLRRIADVYKPQTKTALLLPCTARKPYSLSKTHKRIFNGVGKLMSFVDEIIISSPLVCPREFELTYPAQNYDTPVTGIWSDEEIDFVAENLLNLLAGFEKIIAHVEGGYRRVVDKVEREVESEIVYTSENGVTSEKSLRNLRRELESEVTEKMTENKKDRFMAIFSSMFRYQFGLELEEFVKGRKVKVRGRYPNLELYLKERILRIDNLYGMLDVDLGLAEDLIKKEVNLVEIDEFEPKGTIFSGGVVRADKGIKPNDVVFFRNSKFMGVGRALMSGKEMVEANKGVAIEVKRKKALYL